MTTEKKEKKSRSSLIPSATNSSDKDTTKKTGLDYGRQGVPSPKEPYNPNEESIEVEKTSKQQENTPEQQVAFDEFKSSRTTLALTKLQKVEYDALVELFDDKYEYNYELLGAMIDFYISNLSREERNMYTDIFAKKKKKLENMFLKKYNK